MTPDQWNALIHTIRTAADVAEMTSLTSVPIVGLAVLLGYTATVVDHFSSGVWRRRAWARSTAVSRPPVTVTPSLWPRSMRFVRQLHPAEPTAVIRDGNFGSVYRSGPRPLISEARLGRLRIIREREPERQLRITLDRKAEKPRHGGRRGARRAD